MGTRCFCCSAGEGGGQAVAVGSRVKAGEGAQPPDPRRLLMTPPSNSAARPWFPWLRPWGKPPSSPEHVPPPHEEELPRWGPGLWAQPWQELELAMRWSQAVHVRNTCALPAPASEQLQFDAGRQGAGTAVLIEWPGCRSGNALMPQRPCPRLMATTVFPQTPLWLLNTNNRTLRRDSRILFHGSSIHQSTKPSISSALATGLGAGAHEAGEARHLH